MSDSVTNQFEKLFSPVQVGPITVRNRICETTNSMGASGPNSGGLIDEHFIAHHVAKAKGGTAWIGSETWSLPQPFPDCAAPDMGVAAGAMPFAIYQMPGFVESVARFCDAVHAEGSVAVFQLTVLNHMLSPSSIPTTELYDLVPHTMREEHIEFTLDAYAAAAAAALEAGADGVEIHCAHDTVPETFMSPATNKRTDRWGGDATGRTLFIREGLERIRKVVGNKMAVGIRANGHQARQGGYDLLQFREMIYIIAETGLIDFVDLDVGHCWGRHAYVPPSYHAPAEKREAGQALRTDLDEKVKILFTGRVNEPGIAEELLQAGICDLVGMTRAGIADPDFPNKAREGRLLEMRRCIGCNRCIGEVVHGKLPAQMTRPTCSVNPMVGREVEWEEKLKPAETKKHVAVIGAGPAGLETARVATLRGHQVTLIEQGSKIGGQLRLAAKAPGRDSFEDFLYFSENEIERMDIDLRLDTEATPQGLLELKPDVVVVATGSTPRPLFEVEGAETGHVVQGWDVLAGKEKVGNRVALCSEEDYFETPNIAEAMAAKGKQVTIFHKWSHIGSEIDRYSYGTVMQRLEEAHVEIVAGYRLKKVEGDTITCISGFSGAEKQFNGFDTVVLVGGSVPQDALYYKLKDNYPFEKVYISGSAWLPRKLAEATQMGASIGLEI